MNSIPVAGAILCAAASFVVAASPSPPALTAFVNVAVVPMDSKRVLQGQTVIVSGDAITTIGPANKVKVPKTAWRVDGSGKYLMPGLVDMHVHLRNYSEPDMAALLKVYVANGVTTVLNLSGTPRHLEIRERVAKGELLGPTIYTSGPFISASPNPPPTPDEIEQAVVEQKRAGYDLIKIHGEFTREGYHRLFEVARREGRLVVGHAPRTLGIEVMIEERQDCVAHAEEYIYDTTGNSDRYAELVPKLPDLARATAGAGTWLIPNLTAYKSIGLQVADIHAVAGRPEMRFIPPAVAEQWGPGNNPYVARFGKMNIESFWERYRVLEKLTKAFQEAGVRLLAGTDAMNPSVVPGFSVHDELHDLVAAGLTPYDALRTATANPPGFLGATDRFGTIAVGRRADLVLCEGNPLEDVSNAARRAGVMLRGRWFPEPELRKMLDDVAAAYVQR